MDYPAWKKALIEGMRVFVGTFVAQAVVIVNISEIRGALLSDVYTVYKCLIPYDQVCFLGASLWSNAWVLLVLPAGAAGIKALMKFLREKYAVNRLGNVDYDHWLFKVPV